MDKETVFAAAVLHDIGKLDAYCREGSAWRKVDGYTQSLHLSRGVARAKGQLPDLPLAEGKIAAITHCIGAHHGRIDYGSRHRSHRFSACCLNNLLNLISLISRASFFAGS
jgi:23S rRNA maturation-related 3'-5' exoribonuclease YhaM